MRGQGGAAPAVRARGLGVTYRGADRRALGNVSLDVRKGEMVLVMGASGAGKSTLIKTLSRIVPCFEAAKVDGEVALFGEAIDVRTVGDLAGTVGVIFQDFEAQLFSTNVLCEVAFAMEQLGVPSVQMPERVAGALAAVGLSGFSARDPATLSGGEKQRLAIAGLLTLDPPLLLLDEPTTDLDPVGKAEVLGLLDGLKKRGRTLIVVEHEIGVAAVADRILLLRAGEIVAYGPPRELVTDVSLFESCGVRPHDIARLFVLLGSEPGEWRDVMGGRAGGEGAQAAHRTLLAAGFSPAATDSPEPGEGATRAGGKFLVEVRGVSFAYQDGVPALDDVSFRLAPGEFVAVIGQNGSGKTTLAKHVNGLLKPAAGSVELDGVNLRDIPPHRSLTLLESSPDRLLHDPQR